jgi:hypothetical protein
LAPYFNAAVGSFGNVVDEGGTASQPAETFGMFSGVIDHVNRFGHQTVYVNLSTVVLGVGKNRLAVVPTLEDVMGTIGKGDSVSSWHERSFAERGRRCQYIVAFILSSFSRFPSL